MRSNLRDFNGMGLEWGLGDYSFSKPYSDKNESPFEKSDELSLCHPTEWVYHILEIIAFKSVCFNFHKGDNFRKFRKMPLK